MRLFGLIDARVRGFRVLDVAALAVFLVLALTVYGFKTFAGRERADIVDVESQIRDEDRRVRLLQAELARLQSPARLERLAGQYAGQAPVTVRQEVAPDALPQVAQESLPPPAASP
ncbi:MAG: cell division protein [Caulobacteraceae bacterium]|nr:cell division protein [Caulobacteraceae bacterium]